MRIPGLVEATGGETSSSGAANTYVSQLHGFKYEPTKILPMSLAEVTPWPVGVVEPLVLSEIGGGSSGLIGVRYVSLSSKRTIRYTDRLTMCGIKEGSIGLKNVLFVSFQDIALQS